MSAEKARRGEATDVAARAALVLRKDLREKDKAEFL